MQSRRFNADVKEIKCSSIDREAAAQPQGKYEETLWKGGSLSTSARHCRWEQHTSGGRAAENFRPFRVGSSTRGRKLTVCATLLPNSSHGAIPRIQTAESQERARRKRAVPDDQSTLILYSAIGSRGPPALLSDDSPKSRIVYDP